MTTSALIQRLVSTGIHLSTEGGRLRVEAPPGAITAELRALLANRKADLIEAMSGTRGHLLALAESEGVAVSLVHDLSDADVCACSGFPDTVLCAYLHAMRDEADRMAGRVPQGDTAAILCQHCGPVYVHPSIADVLPVVNGWPRALDCPWCFIRKAGRYIPHPPVACATCRHFQADTINPAAGMGRCAIDAARAQDPPTYPSTSRHCGSWRPTETRDD